MLDVMEPVIAGECFDCVSVVFIDASERDTEKMVKGRENYVFLCH